MRKAPRAAPRLGHPVAPAHGLLTAARQRKNQTMSEKPLTRPPRLGTVKDLDPDADMIYMQDSSILGQKCILVQSPARGAWEIGALITDPQFRRTLFRPADRENGQTVFRRIPEPSPGRTCCWACRRGVGSRRAVRSGGGGACAQGWRPAATGRRARTERAGQ